MFTNENIKVCHLYVCILKPQANTYTQNCPYVWNSSFKKLFDEKEKKNNTIWWFWIDSFDPRPMKGRKEITRKEKIYFTKKLRKIDPCSGVLDFLPFSLNYDENEMFVSFW